MNSGFNITDNRTLVITVVVFAMIIFSLSLDVYHASSLGLVEIISNYPFYFNGNLVPPGKYEYVCPNYNITFEKIINATSSARVYLIGVYINGTFTNKSMIILHGSSIGPTIIQSYYIQQYYVNVSSPVPSPIQSGWYNKSERLSIPSNYYYQTGLTRYVLLGILVNGTPENSIVVNSPLNVKLFFKVQYYVNTTSRLFGYINGQFSLISPNWYDSDTNLTIPEFIYINNLTRLYTYGNVTGQITLTSPLIIGDTQITQYYVKVINPIPAIINGKNSTLTSGWYNESEKIYIPNTIPLINGYRIAIFGNVTGYNTIQFPLVVYDKEVLQYLVNFPFEVNVKISNGTEATVMSLWVDNGTTVTVPIQYHYFSNVSRALVFYQNLTKPNFGSLNYITQYLVQVALPIPASINGINETLTTGWYNQSTNIFIYKVVYLTNSERILVIKINAYNISSLNSPVNINDYYIFEYLINITAYYGTSGSVIYTVNLWEPANSTFQIPSVYEFDGTIFQISPKNSTIFYVTKPVIEQVVYYPVNQISPILVVEHDPNVIIAIILIVAVSLATILFLLRFRNPSNK
jgi:hypothetical protein